MRCLHRHLYWSTGLKVFKCLLMFFFFVCFFVVVVLYVHIIPIFRSVRASLRSETHDSAIRISSTHISHRLGTWCLWGRAAGRQDISFSFNQVTLEARRIRKLCLDVTEMLLAVVNPQFNSTSPKTLLGRRYFSMLILFHFTKYLNYPLSNHANTILNILLRTFPLLRDTH